MGGAGRIDWERKLHLAGEGVWNSARRVCRLLSASSPAAFLPALPAGRFSSFPLERGPKGTLGNVGRGCRSTAERMEGLAFTAVRSLPSFSHARNLALGPVRTCTAGPIPAGGHPMPWEGHWSWANRTNRSAPLQGRLRQQRGPVGCPLPKKGAVPVTCRARPVEVRGGDGIASRPGASRGPVWGGAGAEAGGETPGRLRGAPHGPPAQGDDPGCCSPCGDSGPVGSELLRAPRRLAPQGSSRARTRGRAPAPGSTRKAAPEPAPRPGRAALQPVRARSWPALPASAPGGRTTPRRALPGLLAPRRAVGPGEGRTRRGGGAHTAPPRDTTARRGARAPPPPHQEAQPSERARGPLGRKGALAAVGAGGEVTAGPGEAPAPGRAGGARRSPRGESSLPAHVAGAARALPPPRGRGAAPGSQPRCGKIAPRPPPQAWGRPACFRGPLRAGGGVAWQCHACTGVTRLGAPALPRSPVLARKFTVLQVQQGNGGAGGGGAAEHPRSGPVPACLPVFKTGPETMKTRGGGVSVSRCVSPPPPEKSTHCALSVAAPLHNSTQLAGRPAWC